MAVLDRYPLADLLTKRSDLLSLFTAEERASLDEQYETWKHSPAAEAIVAKEKAKAGLKSVMRPAS